LSRAGSDNLDSVAVGIPDEGHLALIGVNPAAILFLASASFKFSLGSWRQRVVQRLGHQAPLARR
jgi:hypothetical protein